MNGILYGLPVK
jgi:hypothetical protein